MRREAAARARPRGGAQVRARRGHGVLVLRIDHGRLRATVVLQGRHRCVEVLDHAIERLREPEEPRARCEVAGVVEQPELRASRESATTGKEGASWSER